MKKKQRRQKIAVLNQQQKKARIARRPQSRKPVNLQELIADAEREVERHEGYVAEDTQKTATAFRKLLLCSLFYVVMVTFAIISPSASRDAKLSVVGGLSCVLVLPSVWWLFYRGMKKRWEKYLEESVAYLEQLRNRAQNI